MEYWIFLVPYILAQFCWYLYSNMGFPCRSAGKYSTFNAGDLGSITGLGRSPGEGKGYPLQYFGLENSMDCTVHKVAKSWTWLSDFHFTYSNMQAPLYSSWLLHCPLTSQVHPCLSASLMVFFSPHLKCLSFFSPSIWIPHIHKSLNKSHLVNKFSLAMWSLSL